MAKAMQIAIGVCLILILVVFLVAAKVLGPGAVPQQATSVMAQDTPNPCKTNQTMECLTNEKWVEIRQTCMTDAMEQNGTIKFSPTPFAKFVVKNDPDDNNKQIAISDDNAMASNPAGSAGTLVRSNVFCSYDLTNNKLQSTSQTFGCWGSPLDEWKYCSNTPTEWDAMRQGCRLMSIRVTGNLLNFESNPNIVGVDDRTYKALSAFISTHDPAGRYWSCTYDFMKRQVIEMTSQ